MKILFQENSLNLRGTSIAVYDYAFFLKKYYGYECVITFNKNDPKTNNNILKKFKTEFEVIPFNQTKDIDYIINEQQIDVMYSIKSGARDDKITDKAKMCVHAVFPVNVSEQHGDVYAYVSKWLSEYCSGGTLPHVPHMVNLPDTDENYRQVLNIPSDSIVFGRYGGVETFDIGFVYETIKQIVGQNKNVYFLFCNTQCFINHPQVIFTNSITSLFEKTKFINTCNAFLHARLQGETFGLSILEFMSKNKPIFTYGLSPEKNHYSLLDGQGYIYNNQEQLLEMIKKFTPSVINYNQLHNFFPQPVMQQFCSVFLN